MNRRQNPSEEEPVNLNFRGKYVCVCLRRVFPFAKKIKTNFSSLRELSKTFANEPIYLLIYFRLSSSFQLSLVPFLVLFSSYYLILLVLLLSLTWDGNSHFYTAITPSVGTCIFQCRRFGCAFSLFIAGARTKPIVVFWKNGEEDVYLPIYVYTIYIAYIRKILHGEQYRTTILGCT